MPRSRLSCCTDPAAALFWATVSLTAWACLSLIGLMWTPLGPLRAPTILFATSIGCLANWLRNRTVHCIITGPLFFITGLVFLLHNLRILSIRPGLVWTFLLAGITIGFLAELGITGSGRR